MVNANTKTRNVRPKRTLLRSVVTVAITLLFGVTNVSAQSLSDLVTSPFTSSRAFPSQIAARRGVDLSFSDDGYSLAIEVPGVSANDASVTAEGNQLHITAGHKLDERFSLPDDANTSDAKASCIDGVLRVVVLKGRHETGDLVHVNASLPDVPADQSNLLDVLSVPGVKAEYVHARVVATANGRKELVLDAEPAYSNLFPDLQPLRRYTVPLPPSLNSSVTVSVDSGLLAVFASNASAHASVQQHEQLYKQVAVHDLPRSMKAGKQEREHELLRESIPGIKKEEVSAYVEADQHLIVDAVIASRAQDDSVSMYEELQRIAEIPLGTTGDDVSLYVDSSDGTIVAFVPAAKVQQPPTKQIPVSNSKPALLPSSQQKRMDSTESADSKSMSGNTVAKDEF